MDAACSIAATALFLIPKCSSFARAPTLSLCPTVPLSLPTFVCACVRANSPSWESKMSIKRNLHNPAETAGRGWQPWQRMVLAPPQTAKSRRC